MKESKLVAWDRPGNQLQKDTRTHFSGDGMVLDLNADDRTVYNDEHSS